MLKLVYLPISNFKMKILINDFKENEQKYINIFTKYGYDNNELIFSNSYLKAIEFISNYLENKQGHIDLIITNDSKNSPVNTLKADDLLSFKNSITSSFSKNNFRISAIPIMLYSNGESKENSLHGFDSIVKKSATGNHDYFLSKCESLIANWRSLIYNDLDNLGLKVENLPNFLYSKLYKNFYCNNIAKKAESYFIYKTKILSKEFIKVPEALNYDWIKLNNTDIEDSILKFIDTYKNHQKYDRKNGERAILHEFFKNNKMILLRDTYSEMNYELNLNESDNRKSEECDFILKTEYPDFLKTTFFEVKKENVNFYVKKNTKRPQFSSDFLSHLQQVWNYKEFTENPINRIELSTKLKYDTQNFDFVLLAGRSDEKEEMRHLFEKQIDRMFNGVNVITYEELEMININYLDRFKRLNN